MTDWLIWLSMLWLKCFGVLWMMLGMALYLDEQRSRIRRHTASWKVLALKFALAPLTIGYVLTLVAVQPLLTMYRNFAIGCYTSRPGPPVPPGMLSRRRTQREQARQIDEMARKAWDEMDAAAKAPAPPELSCSEATMRAEMAWPSVPNLTREPLVLDDGHKPRYAAALDN